MHWMEVLKDTRYPDIRLITKSETIPLPADKGGIWAGHLMTEGMTNKFIQSIKGGNYQNKGISATISKLQEWKDDEGSFADISDIANIYRLPDSLSNYDDVKNRVDKIVNEVLSILKIKFKEIKTTAKPTISSKMTEEELSNILDNFDEKPDEEKKDILNQLNGLSKDARIKFKNFLTQNYGQSMREYLRETKTPAFNVKDEGKTESIQQVGYDKIKRIGFTSSEDFSKLKYNKTERGTWFKDFTIDTDANEIRAQIQQIDPTYKKYDSRSHPLWFMFGGVSKEEEGTLTQKQWAISEPFGTEKTKIYLNLIKGSLGNKRDSPFRTKKMKDKGRIKTRSWENISNILIELLSPSFDIEETMVENFIINMKSRTFLSKEVLREDIVLKIWKDSLDNKINSDYYLQLIDDQPDNAGLTQNDYSKYRSKILSSLRGDKVTLYDKMTDQYNVAFKLTNSLSQAKMEMLGILLVPEEHERFEDNLLRLDEDIDDLIDELKGGREGSKVLELLETTASEHTFPDKGITVFMFPKGKNNQERLTIIDEIFETGKQDDEFMDIYRLINAEKKEAKQSTDIDISKIIEEQPKELDISSIVDLKSFNGLEKDMAIIVYTVLLSENPISLDNILFRSDMIITEGALELRSVLTQLMLAGNRYSSDNATKIRELLEKIQPIDISKFTSDSPPYVEEIKQVTKLLKDLIPDVRTKITEDVEEKVKDIVKHPHIYQKYSSKKINTDILQILEKKGLIREG